MKVSNICETCKLPILDISGTCQCGKVDGLARFVKIISWNWEIPIDDLILLANACGIMALSKEAVDKIDAKTIGVYMEKRLQEAIKKPVMIMREVIEKTNPEDLCTCGAKTGLIGSINPSCPVHGVLSLKNDGEKEPCPPNALHQTGNQPVKGVVEPTQAGIPIHSSLGLEDGKGQARFQRMMSEDET